MTYTEFSTEKADYVLQLGNHLFRNSHNVFDGIDAMVLEGGQGKLPSYLSLPYNAQYAMLIEHCEQNRIPVFETDVRTTLSGLIRGSFAGFLEIPVDLPILFYSVSNRKVNPLIDRIFSYWSFLCQDPIVEGRNAINARKIEEFVVPRVYEISGKQKPKIGLVFGAAHMGLKHDLVSARRRDFTIRNWRNFNFSAYSSFNPEDLDIVYEAHYDGQRWKTTKHRTGMFP